MRVDAPAIEFVDRGLDHVLEPRVNGADYNWSVTREDARAANGRRPFARPTVRPGDALVFDQLMLHATSWSAEMSRCRYAVEAWFVAPSAYAVDQVPLVI